MDAPRYGSVANVAFSRFDVTDVLIGRGNELKQLRALVENGARRVLIVGAVGLGKTRLAFEFATRLTLEEVVFANVSASRSVHEIYSTVAQSANVNIEGLEPDEAGVYLAQALHSRPRSVVVLDHATHLSNGIDSLLKLLHVHAPSTVVIVTSREHLKLQRAHVFELLPLSLSASDGIPPKSPAVRLLLARMGRAGVAMEPQSDALQTLELIAREVQGVPLALELVAERIVALGASEVASRLARQRALGSRECAVTAMLDWVAWDFASNAMKFFRPNNAPVFAEKLPCIHRDGNWFRMPNGETVSCHNHRVVRKVLAVLLASRIQSPGVALRAEELFARAWSLDRIDRTAALNRLRVAMATLRKLGLREVLLTTPHGYLLDPNVALEVIEEDASQHTTVVSSAGPFAQV